MAGHHVVCTELLQRWLLLGADGLRIGTARMKPASGRWIERTGRLSGKDDFLLLLVRVGGERCGAERLGIGVQRAAVNLPAVRFPPAFPGT